jgi:hypothetical protein
MNIKFLNVLNDERYFHELDSDIIFFVDLESTRGLNLRILVDIIGEDDLKIGLRIITNLICIKFDIFIGFV